MFEVVDPVRCGELRCVEHDPDDFRRPALYADVSVCRDDEIATILRQALNPVAGNAGVGKVDDREVASLAVRLIHGATASQ